MQRVGGSGRYKEKPTGSLEGRCFSFNGNKEASGEVVVQLSLMILQWREKGKFLTTTAKVYCMMKWGIILECDLNTALALSFNWNVGRF
jgi:hypothetical protein